MKCLNFQFSGTTNVLWQPTPRLRTPTLWPRQQNPTPFGQVYQDLHNIELQRIDSPKIIGAFGSYVVFFSAALSTTKMHHVMFGWLFFFNWLQVAVTRKQPFNSRGVLDPKINRTNPSVFAQTSCAKRFTNWDDCSWRPRVSETMVQRSLKKRSFGKNQGMVFDLQGNLKKTKTHTHIKNK